MIADIPAHERSWLEIDLDAVTDNVRRFRRLTRKGVQVIAVVKADAYGHGAVPVARAALAGGAAGLAAANVNEALELRAAGISPPILVLGALLPSEAEAVVEHGLIASVGDRALIGPLNRAAVRQGRPAVVHLKVDTGMGRFGVFPHEVGELADAVRANTDVRVAGAYTHMSQPSDETFTRSQLERFQRACLALRGAGLALPFCHAANTTTAIRFRDADFDAIRPGLGIYGLHGDESLRTNFPLRPALVWKTIVAQLKTYPAGHPVGYDRTFTTARPTRVALLPVGYADGYRRAWSNRSCVLVNGRRSPVIGSVSMDCTAIDVTDAGEVGVGREVILIGRDGAEAVTAEELAGLVPGLIPYEIITSFGKRVARRWHSGPQVSAAA